MAWPTPVGSLTLPVESLSPIPTNSSERAMPQAVSHKHHGENLREGSRTRVIGIPPYYGWDTGLNCHSSTNKPFQAHSLFKNKNKK